MTRALLLLKAVEGFGRRTMQLLVASGRARAKLLLLLKAVGGIGRGPPSGPISEAELIRAPSKEDLLVIQGSYAGRFEGEWELLGA